MHTYDTILINIVKVGECKSFPNVDYIN